VDPFPGASDIEPRITHFLGYVVMAAILAAGVWLSRSSTRDSHAWLRWALSGLLTAISLAAAVAWPIESATWALLGFVAAGCLLLPAPFGMATLAGVMALQLLLSWINSVKIGLTSLPLTVLDIKIALANPAGLWDALALPHWTRHVTAFAVGIAALGWLVAGLVAAARLLASYRTQRSSRDPLLRLAAVCIVAILGLTRLEALYADAALDGSTWQLEGVSALAERMGALPFLGYSYNLESQSSGDIYKDESGVRPPSTDEVRAAVLQYMDFPAGTPGARVQPNIMVVLAESTFDPGATFRLRGKWNDALFRAGEHTAANGLLRVNAMGGGTWITEFETIVGLDSRLFGYSGMYTHASLSPFVDRSIAFYLRQHGYRTSAFFPHGGNFYNARHAYENYGFETIRDSEDLGRGSWMKTDREVAESVRTAMGPAPQAPFFSYVLFIENHSPHDCGASHTADFAVRFADTQEFTPNCALHEYLRRLDSTTTAVQSLQAYLADIEARTGRPYVLLVFGDHQPHTFSSTGGFQYDYSAFRKIVDTRTTFFHILSSVPGKKLRCCSVVPSATMLPTLLSGYVASSPDDVYLGINLWLHARCGTDAVHRDFGNFMSKLAPRSIAERTDTCSAAYESALSWYRASGVVRLGRNP
jgi:phosphoglycerol transferase MdoB-like AlkP superfamily enzyme